MKTIIWVTVCIIASAASYVYGAAFTADSYSPLRVTVIAYYASSEAVQHAVTADVCENGGVMMDTDEAGSKLSFIDRKVYNGVLALLGRVYASVRPTDGELEGARNDFCDAVSDF
jgi:hypothetical protein